MNPKDIILQSGSLSSSLDGGQTSYTITFPEDSLISDSITNDKIRWIIKYEGPTGIPHPEGIIMDADDLDLDTIISNGGDCSVELQYEKIIYEESSSGSLGLLPPNMGGVEYDPFTATGSASASVEEERNYLNPELRLLDGYCVIHLP